jgi:hypothetical protein
MPLVLFGRDKSNPKSDRLLGELTKKYVKAANEEEIMDLADDAAQLAMKLLQLSEHLH